MHNVHPLPAPLHLTDNERAEVISRLEAIAETVAELLSDIQAVKARLGMGA